MKKILILYTTAGYGHKKNSENIAFALRDGFDVKLVDLFDFERGKLVSWGKKIYFFLITKAPRLWDFFYTNRMFLKLTLPLRIAAASFKAPALIKRIGFEDYDIIISTHVNSSAVVQYAIEKGLYHGRFVVAFSDFHLHPYWLFENVDRYLANTPEQKSDMEKLGVPARKIGVCGITLRPKSPVNAEQARDRLGIYRSDKVVLVTGGGTGFGIDDKLVSSLDSLFETTILVVCGKNQELRSKLEQIWAGDKRKKVFGFVENMEELYAIADIVVTKPGGLTIAECLEHRLPIMIYSYIPGQERLNYEYLQEHRLVFPEFMDMGAALREELNTGYFKKLILDNPAVNPIVQYGQKIVETMQNLQ